MNDREALDQSTEHDADEHTPDPVVAALRKAVEAAWGEYRDAVQASQRYGQAMREADLIAGSAETRARSCEAFLRRMETGELDTGGMVQEMTQEQPADQGRGETCPHHVLVQHRDGKPPWCVTCGRTATGALAATMQRRPTTGELHALTEIQVRENIAAWPKPGPHPASIPSVEAEERDQ